MVFNFDKCYRIAYCMSKSILKMFFIDVLEKAKNPKFAQANSDTFVDRINKV